ncbi:hypothetical protein QR680_013440 [Steinernema hermaphroditum]|uniref:non-specific serine/threonine protein kinase n=1 Tax=Steinernema hermaphroditum TaxID=289476 RepID=A0AA39M2I1_9BILA|nr:hypothetical protein QR680_013440 [Steinernema hermaphroditum]
MTDPDKAQRIVRRTKRQKVPKHLLDGHDPKEKLFVSTATHRYQLVDVLGIGGFGVVYKVTQVSSKQQFAMKTEAVGATMKHSHLKIEMQVLRKVADSGDPMRQRHFVKIVDRGKTADFKFIVMEVVGDSLAHLQENSKTGRFDPLTSAYLSYQTAESIDNLHYFGFLHRDIKPHNFCLNQGTYPRTIYLLDFGTSRCFRGAKNKNTQTPRKIVKFVGSVNYASTTGLRMKEQSRRDDFETWFYMVIEFQHPELLVWREARSLQKHIELKEQFMAKSLDEPLKRYDRVREYINRLRYESLVDIDFIKIQLLKSQKLSSITQCIMSLRDGQLTVAKIPTRKTYDQEQEEGSRTGNVSRTLSTESTDFTKTDGG